MFILQIWKKDYKCPEAEEDLQTPSGSREECHNEAIG